MNFTQYAPQAIFKNDKDGVIPTKRAAVAYGTGTNQNFISAVTGKRLLIISFFVTSAGGGLNIKNGSGGAALWYGPGALNGSLTFDTTEFGYFESSTNTAIVVDVATAGANLSATYIEYTP